MSHMLFIRRVHNLIQEGDLDGELDGELVDSFNRFLPRIGITVPSGQARDAPPLFPGIR